MFLLRKPSVLFAFLEMRLCAYPMIGLKRCRHQDILLKIQIPIYNCEEYTVQEFSFWMLLCPLLMSKPDGTASGLYLSLGTKTKNTNQICVLHTKNKASLMCSGKQVVKQCSSQAAKMQHSCRARCKPYTHAPV